jgi:glycosyltransferase involved in cell wall biosynthesis
MGAVKVFNQSGVLQVFGREHIKPNSYGEVAYETAKALVSSPEWRVEDPAMMADFLFQRDGEVFLGWSSPLHYADGYGSVAQEIAAWFLDNGIHLSIYPRDYDPGDPRFGGYSLDEWEEKAFVPRPIVDSLREQHKTPCFYGINMTWPRDVHKHPFCRGFGYTMFETTKPPEEWAACMNKCRRIIVPCQQNKTAFEGIGVTVPIHVVNLGINPEKWPVVEYREERRLRDKHRPFTFLMAAGLTHRKNPVGAALAFLKAFPKEPDVRLVLKTRGEQTSPGFRDWAKNVPADPRIRVIFEESTPTEMWRHMAEADAFVFPSRSEGFGLTPLQAMATGLPTIISGNSGMLEYFAPGLNYLIPCSEVKVPDCAHGGFPDAWGDVGNWWEPDEITLKHTMQYVFRDWRQAMKRGLAAAKWVRQRFSIENTCRGLLEVVHTDAAEDGLSET